MNLNIVWIFLGVFVLWFIYTYNSLINLRNYVHRSFSGIDVQLKRRTDLIPNLVSVVKGYVKHEQKIMEDVANARSDLIKAREDDNVKGMADKDKYLESSLKSLFAVSENYPDLKANSNFLELQAELKRTEDQIAAARRIYNSNVTIYNTKLEVFPSNVVGSIFSFKKEELYRANAKDRVNHKVNVGV